MWKTACTLAPLRDIGKEQRGRGNGGGGDKRREGKEKQGGVVKESFLASIATAARFCSKNT